VRDNSGNEMEQNAYALFMSARWFLCWELIFGNGIDVNKMPMNSFYVCPLVLVVRVVWKKRME